MPRFVLLHHEFPTESPRSTHWDLMLEWENRLWTWAITQPISPAHSLEIPAQRLDDHRLAYLDYEGPVSNDRGTVSQMAAGTFDLMHETKKLIRVTLKSDQLQGEIQLQQTDGDQWTLFWSPA